MSIWNNIGKKDIEVFQPLKYFLSINMREINMREINMKTLPKPTLPLPKPTLPKHTVHLDLPKPVDKITKVYYIDNNINWIYTVLL